MITTNEPLVYYANSKIAAQHWDAMPQEQWVNSLFKIYDTDLTYDIAVLYLAAKIRKESRKLGYNLSYKQALAEATGFANECEDLRDLYYLCPEHGYFGSQYANGCPVCHMETERIK